METEFIYVKVIERGPIAGLKEELGKAYSRRAILCIDFVGRDTLELAVFKAAAQEAQGTMREIGLDVLKKGGPLEDLSAAEGALEKRSERGKVEWRITIAKGFLRRM